MTKTKEYIMDVALKLFLQKNFKEVTMKEIVEKTGLSKGAFYHYFKSKEKFFLEVINNFFSSVMNFDDTKDITDCCEKYGKDCAKNMTDKLLSI